jgi:hypothetical protein
MQTKERINLTDGYIFGGADYLKEVKNEWERFTKIASLN